MTPTGTQFQKRALEVSRFLQPQIRNPELPSVLCMDRPGFEHDITELRRRGQRFNWLRMPSHLWHRLQQLEGIPKTHLKQFGEFDYRAPEFDAGWQLAEAMGTQVLEQLTRDIRLAAVMAANFDYGIDEGMRRACVNLPVAFVTLNREIPLFKFQSNFNHGYYRAYIGRPVVDGVAVGGKLAFDELVDWNILPSERVHITGFPRLDSRIDFLRNPPAAARDAIVLFTYRDKDYLAGGNCDEVVEMFAAASVRHPHISFVIKCKDEDEAKTVHERMRTYPGHRLTMSGNPAALHLGSARAVLGFNSLTLMESLVSEAEILVPQWGDTRSSEENQIYWRDNPEHKKHVTFLDSPDHLDRAIDRIAGSDARQSVDMAGRIALLQQFLHFDPARTATEAVEDFVDHCVRRHGGLVPG